FSVFTVPRRAWSAKPLANLTGALIVTSFSEFSRRYLYNMKESILIPGARFISGKCCTRFPKDRYFHN
ncbi:MAG TPA: hypothetical protein PLQ42_13075, partial [Candidatus Hydrogenedentes bacterium]|nr:hypothetical protein [Candidatus Hydrogenedentota bacterium]